MKSHELFWAKWYMYAKCFTCLFDIIIGKRQTLYLMQVFFTWGIWIFFFSISKLLNFYELGLKYLYTCLWWFIKSIFIKISLLKYSGSVGKFFIMHVWCMILLYRFIFWNVQNKNFFSKYYYKYWIYVGFWNFGRYIRALS